MLAVCSFARPAQPFAYRSANSTGSKLPTHKNLKDRIAALQRLNQPNNSLSTSPNLSATSSFPDPPPTAITPNNNANSNTNGSLRDKIARFEAAGGTPIPRGSFGMGATPSHDDDISRRTGEMLGNRVPGLNRPKALPTEGLGMVSKSHLTVKPVANDSVHRHSRGESQSLGSNHRRFASQSSHSTFTSPSLSAYDGEGGLLEVDEFGGLNGYSSPQHPHSPRSPTPVSPSLLPADGTAADKLPGKLVIPDPFQRRVVSDSQASYGFLRALTPDPELPLQPLEEDAPLASANYRPQMEPESVPEPQTQDDPEEPEVQPPAEPSPQLQISASETPLPPPIDPPREVVAEPAPEPMTLITPEPIPVVGVGGETGVEMEDNQRSPDMVLTNQGQDRDPIPEVSIPDPISVPPSPIVDSADFSSPAPSLYTTPSASTPAAGTPPLIESELPIPEPVEEVVPPPRLGSDDAPTLAETPAPSTLAFPLPPVNTSPISDVSQLQTPPESPGPASSVLTSTSDLTDSTIDYQSTSNHPDPDHDLFVLPLPKDDELPPQPIVQEVEVPRSMYQTLTSPLPTLQAPFDFPITNAGSASTDVSDPNTSFAGDESFAMDASQAEIVIAQSELIRPASPTLLVTMPSPPPTATAFRARTPPPQQPVPPSLGETDDDNTQVSPPRIRKKLYTNHSIPTSFKDTVSPPPVQRSFSAVVHQKKRTSTFVPPDRVDSLAPKSSKPTESLTNPKTPRRKQSLFTEPATPASPGSELAFLVKNAAILEAQLEHKGDSSCDNGRDKSNPAKRTGARQLPRSTLGTEMTKAKSASTPTLVSSSVTNPGDIPPVPDLVYDGGSSNFGFFSNPQLPPFLPQLWSKKSAPHDEADRKSLAPSHKSRKSEKSAKEKDKDSLPRARKLSSRLRSLANSSSNSLKSLGRPSLSSETSVSFDGPTTVSIEPMTPQNTGGGKSRRLGIGSPGNRSQLSHGSESEWGSPPRSRDVLGRASSFADRLLSRAGKIKSGFSDNSQGNSPDCQQYSPSG